MSLKLSFSARCISGNLDKFKIIVEADSICTEYQFSYCWINQVFIASNEDVLVVTFISVVDLI